jgi:hypothetical protein
MWELLNGLIPWKGMDIVQIIQKVRGGTWAPTLNSSQVAFAAEHFWVTCALL